MRVGEAAGEAELRLEDLNWVEDLTWAEGKDQRGDLMVVVVEEEEEEKKEEKDEEWGW